MRMEILQAQESQLVQRKQTVLLEPFFEAVVVI
jgi:hypothetical protein